MCTEIVQMNFVYPAYQDWTGTSRVCCLSSLKVAHTGSVIFVLFVCVFVQLPLLDWFIDVVGKQLYCFRYTELIPISSLVYD